MRIERSIVVALVACALNGASLEDTLTLARKALVHEGVATAWKLSQKAVAEAGVGGCA